MADTDERPAVAAEDEPPAKKQKQGSAAKAGEHKAGTQKGKGGGLTLQEVSFVLAPVRAGTAARGDLGRHAGMIELLGARPVCATRACNVHRHWRLLDTDAGILMQPCHGCSNIYVSCALLGVVGVAARGPGYLARRQAGQAAAILRTGVKGTRCPGVQEPWRALTVVCGCDVQIASDKVTKLAKAHWSNEARSKEEPPAFSGEIVSSIYKEELGGASDAAPSFKRMQLLEISLYLENFLWPHFDAESATFEHVMSIICMVNEKFREGVPAWTCFHTREVRVCVVGGEGAPQEGGWVGGWGGGG